MSSVVDQARGVRAGEELNVEALKTLMREHCPEQQGEIEVRQYPSGHSNLTYLIRWGDSDYVLRRPPFGSKVKSAHDMGREYRVLSQLSKVFPLAPKPFLYVEDESVLGCKFYLMERIMGIILRKDIPPDLQLLPTQIGELHAELIQQLANLHQLDWQSAGFTDFGKPEGYVERQVRGWAKRYQTSKTNDIASVDKMAQWLEENMPKESGAALIHNDYKLDNVVLDPTQPTKMIGILDWEMSTIGDPLMDLGTSLSYWIEANDHESFHMIRWAPTHVEGSLTREQLADHYAKATGISLDNIVYYYCFGLFKTAVVLQQIYYRYHHGLTKDSRFAPFIMGVQILTEEALRAVERGRLSS
jgi:aminoglycoside phosphotransferase (APT) family kinase protein